MCAFDPMCERFDHTFIDTGSYIFSGLPEYTKISGQTVIIVPRRKQRKHKANTKENNEQAGLNLFV